MPISFTCPHCGLQTNVADHFAGQSGPCAGCGKTVVIPPPGAVYGPPPSRGTGAWPVVAVVLVVGLVCVVFCGGILVALLLPAVQAAREAARRSQCSNNLKQIGLALHNYHSTYACFPPAYVADKDGRPMHSWRVLLLPYMEQQALYRQYRFDEPWDGPNNQRIASTILQVYQCPSDPPGGAATTNYVMIVGPGTLSDGASCSKISDVHDGTSNTIAVVEIANSGIGWAEPRDLDAATITFAINDGSPNGISSRHPGVANALLLDGSVRAIPATTDPSVLRALSTIAGNERVGVP